MIIVLTVTLTLTNLFLPRLKTIRHAIHSIVALYAADSAMEMCLYEIRTGFNDTDSDLNEGHLGFYTDATFVIASLSAPPVYVTNDCSVIPSSSYFNIRATATYKGTNRSFEVSTSAP